MSLSYSVLEGAMFQVTCNWKGLGCGWKIKFVTFVVLFWLFKLPQHMVLLNLKIFKSNNSTHYKLFHMMFRTFSWWIITCSPTFFPLHSLSFHSSVHCYWLESHWNCSELKVTGLFMSISCHIWKFRPSPLWFILCLPAHSICKLPSF